jgi:histidine triad (HIT) family protein
MVRDPQCVFCKIVAHEIPAAIVYQDENVVGFLDIGPLAEGHLLVIPKAHFARLHETPAEDCARVATVIPLLGRTLLSVCGAAGFNLLCNDGQVAGQVVTHVHFHLIPRRQGDSLGYRWNAGTYAEGRLNELAAAFRRALDKSG